jgi:hypothetical protein
MLLAPPHAAPRPQAVSDVNALFDAASVPGVLPAAGPTSASGEFSTWVLGPPEARQMTLTAALAGEGISQLGL